jgi:hypothetical protein
VGPQKYVTESEVRVLITASRDEYEEKVGAVRHRENGVKFDRLTAALNRALGGFAAISAIVGGVELYLRFHGK